MRSRCRIGRVWLCASLTLASGAIACWADEREVVRTLREPVEILRDTWGISHIYARNEHDLFVAQGYTAARDRLFQLEIWRRQATGTLAEIQGARALVHDVGARLLKYRGDMGRELSHYHPHGPEIVAAFVDGINAYVDLVDREPNRLPFEFRVLGIKPGKWTADVVVSRHNALVRNVKDEVQYAQLVQLIGSERARSLLNLHPGSPTLKPDPALDLSLVSDVILETYKASRSVVKFRPEDVGAAYRRRDASPSPARKAAALDEHDETAEGSNNWVIAGTRTSWGGSFMANDPHRAMLLPSLRYWIHLVAPGWNVIGAGEPALPGVSVGHNERGAWGFTIFPIDQEDLYVYETDPANPLSYRYGGAWEAMSTTHESIAVKGVDPVHVELKFTRHGPVVWQDEKHNRAYALKAVWLEPGTAPYLASLRLDQAGSWDEFREGCKAFFVPSENMVWADVDGHIGWQAVGLAPRRQNWEGLLPVPGDGRHEWQGFIPALDLPHVVDPPQGWLATANQDNLPPDYPFHVSYQWTDPFRYRRIEQVLAKGKRHTQADMVRLQVDELSLPARALVPFLRGLKPEKERTIEAVKALLSWNFVLNHDSASAAIYVAWERACKSAVWNRVVPKQAQAVFPVRSLSTEKVVQWLTAPDERLGPDPVAARDALLLSTLDAALVDVEHRLGPDMSHWRYGDERFKRIYLKHPLSDCVTPDGRLQLDIGPFVRGGYAHTVHSTSDDDNQSAGASFRIIADTGDWDRSIGTNIPGQSGDPESRHYRDLIGRQPGNKYFPAFFSRAKVESVTAGKVILAP